MSRQQNSLKPWNTFGIDAYANKISVADSIEALCQCWQQSVHQKEPVLLLGEGSNVLFLNDFHGQILINRIKGISITETTDAWLLHAGAGENWHQLVETTLDKGLAGLENLALIPGCVGSAPIQNIGAYGVELEQVCEYVDIVSLDDGVCQRLSAAECQFGYRDSVFKHHYREGYAIVAVGFKLNKSWRPVLSYGDLRNLDPLAVTPKQIFDAVCQMRRSKLPDPDITGNAGSFFKNPLVSAAIAAELHTRYPDIPQYPQKSGEVKLAAGWLIDRCSLKGFRVGGAAVHEKQALVLINTGTATGQDIVDLARTVRQRVAEKFNVWLEPEVRFIASQGETDAVKAMS
ncbi:UDP-N-acetylmuramate dehydrogenase [Erwinia pyrifoliae]|uniref:UDP-N-acetylenolpyruvoylglucosamine reductase n=1 Tax=Erwinia pyrifoliae TaxID=79967 RepID=A0ABY5XA46_ERWPY|nr:UDP-N-acetylmuramate dehydrogenase [Erwinia pyrifoliae]AUX74144.1 UDP-N-acetylmuramate dehydrogenase [Erwinia pyrifoliae]MCA8875508.1 UDP-N-acetylmuramate dehydrogenase [Erwinia pyrifoliae]MCT2385200.1 UDP-N-acetylmuramate dehydrogenase [Erwinia pyrifoliae]MCU8585576.1 UDP-N-acetylmuramate dehydrogenase [Erwinia pyrifoliae]UWS33878.1 UDP-N-acetylmuramate dehydrogenase [Erwinia pyrifoliae]